MDGQTIDIIVMIAYLACVVLIGYYSMNQIEDFDDYAVAGRSIPAALIFGTIGATLCGGGATIGRISFVHKQGLIVFVALIGVVVCQIFSGLLIAPRVRQIGRNVYTISDLFGMYYGRAGRLSSSLVAFFFLMSMMGVQLLAMGRILETILNMDFVVATVLSTVITVTYTWAGGMIAVLLTDAVQFVVIALGLSIAAYLGLEQVGGLTNAVDIITSRSPESAMLLDFFRDDWSPLKLGAFFLAFMLGDMCTPYYIQRYATAASPKDSKVGVTLFSVYYIFFLATTAAIGIVSVCIQPSATPDLAMTSLVQTILPAGISGLVMAALLAAVMSTGDSLFNTGAVTFTRDIYNEFINPQATQRQLLVVSKAVTILLGIGATLFALVLPDVLGLMVHIYPIWGPAIILPLFAGLLWGKIEERRASPYAGMPSILLGGLTALIWGPVLGDPFGIPNNILGMAVCLITFLTVHLVTRSWEPKGIFAPEHIETTGEDS